MERAVPASLDAARDSVRLAARWLQVLRFAPSPAGTSFSPSLMAYADMLAPDTTDERRLAACRALHPAVVRAAMRERDTGEAEAARTRRPDPYRAHWRTTERGAALEVLATLLAATVKSFEAHGVTTQA